MRTVTLINSRGEQYDVTRMDSFFSELSGFGYSRENVYRSFGNRFSLASTKLKMGSPSGKMIFAGEDPYSEYYKFISFCNASPLVMRYDPNGNIFYRKCVLSSITKGELDHEVGVLKCDIKFDALTPWYRTVVKVVEPNDDEINGWTWGSSEWPIKWATDRPMSIVMESDTNEKSPCKLTIYGPIVNPSWNVYSSDGLEYTGKVNVSVPEGCYLEVDNTTIPFSITLYDSAGAAIEDEYQKSDMTTDRFIYLKRGINTINVTSNDGSEVPIKAEGELYYESV